MIPHSLSSKGFAVFRVVFGIYLILHFGMLIPWSAELFSQQGVLPDPTLNPLHGLFPNPLVSWDSPTMALCCTIGLTLLSICFTLGWARRTVSLLLWFAATALFHRNNLTANPSLAYIGLLLILCTLIPPGERLRGVRPRDWEMPRMVVVCAWVLLAVGYFFSGLTKLGSQSWSDGSAIARLLENPLARNWSPREWALMLPAPLLQTLTWGTLAAELLFLPCCMHPATRKWASICMVLLHLGILLLVDFADLTCGMIMIHLFTLDPRWLPQSILSHQHQLNPNHHPLHV